MNKLNKDSKFSSTNQAIAILAVNNLHISKFGIDVLKRHEEGLITYEEGKQEIIDKAKSNKMKI